MEHKITSLEEIKLIGIQTRTSNDTAQTDIPELWQKFYSENIKGKIRNKINEDVLSLYTGYESDYTKPYTIVIGCKVNDFSDVPEGMVSEIIPPSKFAVFTAKGKMPDKIVETWQNIWNSKLERSYIGDFEIYSEKYNLPEPEVDIYVAVK
ncbi:MAG: GyrI-like domain-containing protein [Bacteroidota bacterium]|nr:GyrI-like domain-containing protein [Bacteroidota bacterium]